MKTMHMLTDVYGPRLTGSPNHKRAAEWAIKQMTAVGTRKWASRALGFQASGLAQRTFDGAHLSPVKDALVVEVLAWTPGTRGVVRANAYQLILPERPTQPTVDGIFREEKSKVRGRIVLVGKHQIVPVNLNPPAKAHG